MLSAEEYLKYGAFMCHHYYKLYGADCEDHCPFGLKSGKCYNNSFCVFPDLQTLENGYFNFIFAIKVVEDFKNTISKTTSLKEIFLEKLPDCEIDEIIEEHCPLMYFTDISCYSDCTKGSTIKDCWNKKITIENDEFKKFINNLETITLEGKEFKHPIKNLGTISK